MYGSLPFGLFLFSVFGLFSFKKSTSIDENDDDSIRRYAVIKKKNNLLWWNASIVFHPFDKSIFDDNHYYLNKKVSLNLDSIQLKGYFKCLFNYYKQILAILFMFFSISFCRHSLLSIGTKIYFDFRHQNRFGYFGQIVYLGVWLPGFWHIHFGEFLWFSSSCSIASHCFWYAVTRFWTFHGSKWNLKPIKLRSIFVIASFLYPRIKMPWYFFFRAIFLSIYLLEFIVNIIASGFILDKFSYLRNPWNRFDLILIIIS